MLGVAAIAGVGSVSESILAGIHADGRKLLGGDFDLRLTHRDAPIYHSTYTGKPPDEPAVLGVALNEVFVPILRKRLDAVS